MSDCRREWNREDELPVYLARPVTTGPAQRHKHCGMFSSVEGAFDSKTIDFDSAAVSRRGSRTPRSGSRERILDGDYVSETARVGSPSSPGNQEEGRAGVDITHLSGNDSFFQQDNGEVSYINIGILPTSEIVYCINGACKNTFSSFFSVYVTFLIFLTVTGSLELV